jgi:type I restriction enzyme S subunit
MTEMPPGWQATTFGAVLTETHERRGEHTDLPVLSVTKTRGPMLASERFGKALHGRDLAKYRVARRGTIVADPMLLWDGSIGRQDVVDAGLVSPDYRVFELTDQVSSDFMRYVVRNPSMLRHYQGGARGTNVRRNRIARGDFLRIPLRLPPLLEQRKIAAILSAVDVVIEKTEAVIESLQALKKAMVQGLLTRGFPGGHTRFKQTEIGELPEEWDVRPLAEVGHVQTGIAKGKVTTGNAVPVPYLRVANVQDGYLDLEELKTIDVEPNQVDRYRLLVGDVLFTEGGDADKLGRGCVWSGEIDLCIHQNHVFAVRVDSDRVVPQFLALFGASPVGKAYFMGAAKQTTNLASINSTQLKALPVPVPSIDEQREIVRGIGTCSDRIDRERRCADAVRRTKAALMSALLTGELRVTPDEGAA